MKIPIKKRTNTYLYIAFNPAMPGWVKFGQTTKLDQRMNQLSSSSPVPFILLYKIKIRRDWALKVESHLKREIGQFYAEKLPRNSYQRSHEWVDYNHHRGFNSSRTFVVNWIKKEIKNSLKFEHMLSRLSRDT